MKRKLFFLVAILISFATSSFAQEDDTVAAPPQTTVPAAKPGVPAVKPVPARPKSIDTIRGNAGKEVGLVQTNSGTCANNMTPMGVINKSATRAMKVGVEVMVVFMGRVSKKNVIVDNLAPNETRFVGCLGCVDNTSGKTCTTYKIFAAMYK